MHFTSFEFVAFLSVVLAVHWAVPRNRIRTWVLLAAGLWFYGSWNPWLAGVVAGSTLADYFIGRGLGIAQRPGVRKLLLAASLTFNIGLLVFFKYSGFLIGNLERFLHAAGWEVALAVPTPVLPIGISFYTFEAISYTVDVYRGKIRPERRFDHLLLFILFFPHLIAGPIVRGAEFLPQIRRTKLWNWARVNVGLGLIVLGLLKKLALADRLAQFVDPVFADPTLYNTKTHWLAAIAFALQLYGDFSGYSDMAVGIAHLFGYKLPDNFDAPYTAGSPSDFWRRWHITLSSWLRDYVYIPLGGSRGSTARTCVNLMVVMVVAGAWHGAAWNFIVFGALWGVALVLHRLVRPWLPDPAHPVAAFAVRMVASVGVFTGWVLLLVFFRNDLTVATTILERLFVISPGIRGPLHENSVWFSLAAVMVYQWGWTLGISRRLLERLPGPLLGILYALAASLALLLAPPTSKPFVYFQF